MPFMSVQKVKAFEGESFEVCVHINGTLSQDITLYLNSFDGSAIGKHHLCVSRYQYCDSTS